MDTLERKLPIGIQTFENIRKGGFQIKMQNRILLPFLLQLFNCQTLKKVFTPLKIGFKSRNKQTFAETTGTTQEIRLSRIPVFGEMGSRIW